MYTYLLLYRDISQALPAFTHLLLVRAMRADRVVPATKTYIRLVLGEAFLDITPNSVETAFAAATEKTPLVLSLLLYYFRAQS